MTDREPNSANGEIRPKPDVSILVAAHNVAPFIGDAIQSALDQKHVTVEIIVIDDASTDDTAAIVEQRRQSDPRIILLRQTANGGPAAARNAGLRIASGTWVAVLDGDDLIDPDRTRRLIDLAGATSADLVGDNFQRITFDGRPTGAYLFPQEPSPFTFLVDPAAFISANTMFARKKRSLGAIKIMVRNEFLQRHDITHPEDVPVGEDYLFILSCLLRQARFVVTSEPGYRYRLRPGSQSWRLSNEHMTRLMQAHQRTLRDLDILGSPEAQVAGRDFTRALTRSTDFVRIVTLAKQGAVGQALSTAIANPAVWPLLVRQGTDAVTKRIRRVSANAAEHA
jgi:succinoglycan biosynthesis protein ExoO